MSQIKEENSFNPEHEKPQLQEKILKLLELARKNGATQAEVGGAVSSGFTTTVRLGNIETLEHHRDKEILVTIYLGQRKGSASTTDVREESLQETLEKAFSIAKFTSEDHCSGLADAHRMAVNPPDLELFHPWDIRPADVITDLINCEKEAMAVDARLFNSEGATSSASQGISIYGNSHGFIGTLASSRYDRSLSLIAKDTGGMERDYDFTLGRDKNHLRSFSDLAQQTAKRTLMRLNPKKIKTNKLPIIFHHEIATGLLGSFFSAIRGSQLYRRSSFLLDSIGQQIFPDFLTLHENPFILSGLASTPYDSEGVATSARDIVKDGMVQGYVLGSYSARKLGLQSTGNAGGIHNIEVKTKDIVSFEALLKKMDTGFLVTEVMGQGINIITGDYSRGAAGFWVENGQIQYPVSEVTISGNLRDIFKGIKAISNDIETRSSIQTGSILIEEMMVAGN